MTNTNQNVPVPDHFSDMTTLSKQLLRPGISREESQALYNQLASLGAYDKLHDYAKYSTAYDKLMAAVLDLFPNHNERKDVAILDVGAGTGKIGQRLRDAGFEHVDALDPSPEMLKIAQNKGVYKRYISSFFTQQPVDCIEEDAYDLLVMCGVCGPGAVPVEAFKEVVRILKPGGYVVNCLRAEYLYTCPEYQGRWEPFMLAMVEKGKMRLVSEHRYPRHFFNYEGLRLVYQIL
ncbi:methyltransferase-like protein 27 [Littorina saxatilis]|uniref:Methyltransferase type 12 domain-containing protein n=1 Tax=Littorina saxatilis TaxID=31220 RepID=A0AAN9BS54_9CAEN